MDGFADLPPSKQNELLNGPAMRLPQGEILQLNDPPNSTDMAIAVWTVLLFLVTVTGIARCYVRLFVVKTWKIEDYLGVVAFLSYLGLVWSAFEYLHTVGILVHQWNIRLGALFTALRYAYTVQIFYCVSMLFLKTAILLEWSRIFVPAGRRNYFYWISRILIGLNCGMYIASTIGTALWCTPVEKSWRPYLDGTCINRKQLDIPVATVNIIVDLFILLLPQRILWSLQMDLPRKIGLSIIFSIGLLACACAALRVWNAYILDIEGDATYVISQTYLIGYTEISLVLLVFFVPTSIRVFNRENWIFRLLSAIHSRLTPRPLTTGSANMKSPSMFPPTIGSEPNKHMYRMVDEEGQLISMDELSFSRLTPIARPGRAKAAAPVGDTNNNIVVVKTVEFASHEDSASKCSMDPATERNRRQHPWTAP